VIATLATAVFFAVGFKVVVTNVVVGSANDPAVHVAAIQRQLPPEARLVSFTAIHHRFEHYFGSAIEERPWPETAEDVPAEVDYFCFVRRPSDTAQQRLAGRVWNFYTTTGGLPFPWEEVGTVSMARKIDETDQPVVVVGRVKRDTERLAAVDGQTPH
jgi:hypothetical protein